MYLLFLPGSDHPRRAWRPDAGRAQGMSEDHPAKEPELSHRHRGSVQGGDQQVQAHPPVQAAGGGAAVVLLAEQEDQVNFFIIKI